MKDNIEKGKNIKVRVFNVVLQPADKHKEVNYVALIEKVFNSGNTYCTSTDKNTKMRSLSKMEHMIYGTLVNFTVIKEGTQWYDTEKDSFKELPVDPSLNPNAKEWDFYFDTEHHRIAVPSKRGVSYSQVYQFFNKAFTEASEALGFDDVTVSSITSNEGIEQIFELDEIDTLTIEVSYSNNDNNNLWEKAIDDQLKETGAGRMKTTVKAPKNGKMFLKDNSFLGGMVKLSQNNGSAKAEGKKAGKVTKVNTDNYPKEVKMTKVTEANIFTKIKAAIQSVLN